jgi:hypothetical protein
MQLNDDLFLWVNSSIWGSKVSHREREHMPTHTLDRFVLSSVALYTHSLPVTTHKTSFLAMNNDYLSFSHTTARWCIIFFFSLELTSSHSCTHSRNRTERSRKKKEEKGSNCDRSVAGYRFELYHKHYWFRESFEYIYLCTWEGSKGGCLFSSKCEYNREQISTEREKKKNLYWLHWLSLLFVKNLLFFFFVRWRLWFLFSLLFFLCDSLYIREGDEFNT